MIGGKRRRRSSVGQRMASREPGKRRGGGGFAPKLVIVVAVGALVLVAATLVFRGKLPVPGAPAPPAAAAHDAAGWSRLGREAALRGAHDAALATYRDGLRAFPSDPVLLGSYAKAIKNRSFAVRMSRGRAVPVAATSHERVAAALEALALLDAAQRAQPNSPEPALQKGMLLAAWGLPEDALVELYGAVVRGSRAPELERTAGAITLLQLGRGSELDQNGSPSSR